MDEEAHCKAGGVAGLPAQSSGFSRVWQAFRTETGREAEAEGSGRNRFALWGAAISNPFPLSAISCPSKTWHICPELFTGSRSRGVCSCWSSWVPLHLWCLEAFSVDRGSPLHTVPDVQGLEQAWEGSQTSHAFWDVEHLKKHHQTVILCRRKKGCWWGVQANTNSQQGIESSHNCLQSCPWVFCNREGRIVKMLGGIDAKVSGDDS